MKKLIYKVNKRFRLGRKRAVPHISLAGPLTTHNENRLVKDFTELCKQSPLMKFTIDGFGCFDNNRVVFVNIKPSEQLGAFRWELSKKLQPYCQLKQHDCKKDFEYHATIAMRLDPVRFQKIKSYITALKEPNYKHFMLRVTLIKDAHILCEYDFLQQRMLNRSEAKSKGEYLKTKELLKKFFAGNYSPNKCLTKTETIQETTKNEIKSSAIKSFIKKIKSILKKH